ncbi:MAG: hypothetical protein EPN93_15710 [Spirochaetes bacterium]|nr:MAG: hypothetical protein EPN93_15710 [Spirochaetota bacterium]
MNSIRPLPRAAFAFALCALLFAPSSFAGADTASRTDDARVRVSDTPSPIDRADTAAPVESAEATPLAAMWVILVIWAGIAVLLLRLDMRVTRLEKKLDA